MALRDGQGFTIRPLFSAGAKGVESGVKGRQIRRPFHSDYDLLRIKRMIEFNDKAYCIMERIEGTTLEKAWTQLSWLAMIKLAVQLRRFIRL